MSIITGCAHPEILKIIDKVRVRFPEKEIFSVFGGFHLMKKTKQNIREIVQRFIQLGIKKVGPTHCSGTDAENLFRKAYKENCLTLKAGEEMEV